MMVRSKVLLALTTTLLVLAACGGGTESDTPSGGEPPGLSKLDGDAKANAKDLIKKAEQEGGLVLASPSISSDIMPDLTEEFRTYWGLSADFQVQSSFIQTSKLITQLDAQISASKVKIDVADISAVPWLEDHIVDGNIMKYDSPEYSAYPEEYNLGASRPGYYAPDFLSFTPMWNKDDVPSGITSWTDLLNPEFNGNMVVGDASISTSYAQTYYVLQEVLPEDFFAKLSEQDPVFKVRSPEIAQDVLTGASAVTSSGMPQRAFPLNEKGADIQFVYPKEGVVLLPQSHFILEDAPHPNASKLWQDFFLSKEGQEAFVKASAFISGRKGFESPEPKYAPPISDLNVIPVDWAELSQAKLDAFTKEWTATMK